MPAPLPSPSDIERLRALHAYDILDTPAEASFDDLVQLAATLCDTPFALITLMECDRQWFKARLGVTITETTPAQSFCIHTLVEPGDMLIVTDACLDPRFAQLPWVAGDPGLRFYAGVVLRSPEGHALGTLCVADTRPRSLPESQRESLRKLGRQVMAQLNLRRGVIEAKLEHSRLVNSQRIAGIGDWEVNETKHSLHWSEGIYRLLGVSPQEGPPTSAAFYQRVHPDDLDFVKGEKAAVGAGERRVDFEHRIVLPDGTVRNIHQIAETTFDSKGGTIRESGTLQDVTDHHTIQEALRRSEERFSLVARAVTDVLWDWNLITNERWSSRGFLGSSGQLENDNGQGAEFWAGRIHPDDHNRVVDSLHHAIETGADSWQADYRLRCRNGAYALVQDRGYIVRDAAGKGVRMIGGMRDVTEQRSLEARYLRAQRMEGIGTLAGGIAHDLNNVLAPILLSIDLLKLQGSSDPEYEKVLDTISQSSRRGANLVRQVLSFARGSDGQKLSLQVGPLIRELGGMIRETFPPAIAIVIRLASDRWLVNGDPTQLNQVLLNLAVNARDAMPRGGTLTLTVENTVLPDPDSADAGVTGTRHYVLIKVSDTGTGISPEIQERIFEPFFTTKPKGSGTGLGLATVHTIVKRHGGFITVDSEVGRGTIFMVYLPAESSLKAAIPPEETTAEATNGNGELILIVDDEPAIRHITQQTLESHGYRVLTAANGKEAIALYIDHARDIALVLTDTSMPVMDGAATIAALLELNPSVKVITMSGLIDPAAEAAVAGMPNRANLEKPYSAATLLQQIHEMLRQD
ncbi:MAG: PAS domain-containing protein [Opitutaceae bacterium]